MTPKHKPEPRDEPVAVRLLVNESTTRAIFIELNDALQWADNREAEDIWVVHYPVHVNIDFPDDPAAPANAWMVKAKRLAGK